MDKDAQGHAYPSTLTADHAKEDVFGATYDFFNYAPFTPDDVSFMFDSCDDNGGPPFQAAMYIRAKLTTPALTVAQMQQATIKALLKIPGWTSDNGNYHTHAVTISKYGHYGIVHIDIPAPNGEPKDEAAHIYGLTINGPCTVTQDMREIDADPNVPKDEAGFPGLATDPQDYTNEFK